MATSVTVWYCLLTVILGWRSEVPIQAITVGVLHPVKQLASFSPANMSSILNLFRISPHGEAVN